jgi:hypothetical protein
MAWCVFFDILIFWSHIKASFSDPGFLPEGVIDSDCEDSCAKCGADRPEAGFKNLTPFNESDEKQAYLFIHHCG